MAEELVYEVSDEVRNVANKVLEKDSEKLAADYNNVVVTYIKTYPSISKNIVGLCTKPGRLLKYFSESDIIIQVSGNIWDNLNEETRYILMLHEMKHVRITYKKNGRMIISLNPHNVQDFSDIIRDYGIDWLESIKSISASTNNFENGEEDNLKL
jgi:PDZ domain-containing secreted protein